MATPGPPRAIDQPIPIGDRKGLSKFLGSIVTIRTGRSTLGVDESPTYRCFVWSDYCDLRDRALYVLGAGVLNQMGLEPEGSEAVIGTLSNIFTQTLANGLCGYLVRRIRDSIFHSHTGVGAADDLFLII